MKRFFKTSFGSAGLSLIELIISMAILAIVGTAVGGAMFVSSKSYTRGSAEVNVQEEAQIASNLICDWLADATAVDPDGLDPITGDFLGVQTVDLSVSGSKFIITHPDPEFGEIKINIFIEGDALVYQLEGESDKHVLANSVTGAIFNSSFGKDRNVNFSIDFEINDRTYHAVTDSTSRNHEFIATAGDVSANPIIEYNIPKVGGDTIVVLEPCMTSYPGVGDATFTFKAVVKNYIADPADGTTTFAVNTPSINDTSVSINPSTDPGEPNVWNITVSANSNASADAVYTFTATNTYSADGSTKSTSSTVRIQIRRDNMCQFYTDPVAPGAVGYSPCGDEWVPATGEAGKKDSVYYTQVELGIQNGNQIFGAPYDSGTFGYKDPGDVQFFFKMAGYTQAQIFSSYVEIVDETDGCTYYTNGVNAGRAATSPRLSIKLKDNLPEDLYVIVVAPHSGSAHLSSYGVNVDAVNKTSAIIGNSMYFGYGDDPYYDVIKIGKTSGREPFRVGNNGFRRGTPSFEIARMDPDFLDDIDDKLAEYANTHGLNPDWKADYDYYFSFNYTMTSCPDVPANPELGVTRKYVVSKGQHWTNILAGSGHAFTQMFQDESYLFRPDCDYSVELCFDVYVKGTSTRVDECCGTKTIEIPSTQAYIYNNRTGSADGSSGYFEVDTYPHAAITGTAKKPLALTSSDLNDSKDRMFYIYFNNMNVMNGPKPGAVLQYLDGSTWKNVVDTNPALADTVFYQTSYELDTWTFNNVGPITITEGSFNGKDYGLNYVDEHHVVHNNVIHRVYLNDADHSVYDITAYDENMYPDFGVSITGLVITGKAGKPTITVGGVDYPGLQSGVQYRIAFCGEYKYVPYSASLTMGSVPGNEGQIQSSNVQNRNFALSPLTGSSDNGFIYFTYTP